MLSTVPAVDWVLLGSGESNKGYICGSLNMQLVCRTHLASWQEKRVTIITIKTVCWVGAAIALERCANPAGAMLELIRMQGEGAEHE